MTQEPREPTPTQPPAGFPVRLLANGLPLPVLLGSLLAAWLLDDLTWALAGFVGATLAPTDAALSALVINDRRIPVGVRRVLTSRADSTTASPPPRRLQARGRGR